MKKASVLIAIMLIMAVSPSSGFPWRYDSSYDRMRDEQTKLAYIQSNTMLHFGFPYQGGSLASLILQENKHQGLIVALQVDKGQFNCSAVERCIVYAKFDTGKVLTFHGEPPADGRASIVLITPAAKVVSLLKKSKQLTLEAEFYQEGTRQIEFDVTGLEWESDKGAKEIPIAPEKPQGLEAIEKNLDKLIAEPKGVSPTSSATAEQGSLHESPDRSGVVVAAVQLYCERVRNAIGQEFKLPDQNIRSLDTTVSFVVSSNGQVLSIQIEKPSGNSLFDEAAVRAIQNAHLPVMPPVLNRSKQDFRFKFSSQGVS